jgi:hypothetical protein
MSLCIMLQHAEGAVTELTHPYIRNRWDQLMEQFTGGSASNHHTEDARVASGATEESLHAPGLEGAPMCNESAVQLTSDFIFEDQLGARHVRCALLDRNLLSRMPLSFTLCSA